MFTYIYNCDEKTMFDSKGFQFERVNPNNGWSLYISKRKNKFYSKMSQELFIFSYSKSSAKRCQYDGRLRIWVWILRFLNGVVLSTNEIITSSKYSSIISELNFIFWLCEWKSLFQMGFCWSIGKFVRSSWVGVNTKTVQKLNLNILMES